MPNKARKQEVQMNSVAFPTISPLGRLVFLKYSPSLAFYLATVEGLEGNTYNHK